MVCLGAAAKRGAGFWPGPHLLFGNGEKGALFIPSPGSCFTDTSLTTRAAVGQGVAGMMDLSGNGCHATQGTPANCPILRQNATTGAYYLEFDGTDDRMVTSAIDLSGTDEITVFVAQRKLTDPSIGTIVETDNSSGNGTFLLMVTSPTYEYWGRSKGTVLQEARVDNAAFAAPHSAVLTLIGATQNSGASNAALRVNGTQVAANTNNQGSVNYGNYAMDIGARSSSNRYNGHIYGIIVRGAASDWGELERAESWLNEQIGAY